MRDKKYMTLIFIVINMSSDVLAGNDTIPGSGLQGVVAQSLLSQSRYAKSDGLQSLENYNRTKFWRPVDIEEITRFLDEQIHDFGLDPKDFRYFIGDDWQVIRLPNGQYGLVVPSASPSNVDTVKHMFGYSKMNDEPEHALNIIDLDKNLARKIKNKTVVYNQYRLAIKKALIEAKSNNTLLGAWDSIVTTGVAAIGYEVISSKAALAVQGLGMLYNYTAGKIDEIKIQKAIDTYILESNDIDLIQAYITDLENQLKEEKESYTTKAYSYLPSALQSKEKSVLQKRLEYMKHYLEDNDIELRMLKQFGNKAHNKK